MSSGGRSGDYIHVPGESPIRQLRPEGVLFLLVQSWVLKQRSPRRTSFRLAIGLPVSRILDLKSAAAQKGEIILDRLSLRRLVLNRRVDKIQPCRHAVSENTR